jgi:hypothetical protein
MCTAAKVAQDRQKHPERYCPANRCLWRTNGGYCPRHKPTAMQWIRNGYQLTGKAQP